MTTKLDVRNLTFSYGFNYIMESLSLHVEENEFVSLVGPSGCGKSTLFTLIGGVEKPLDGEIWLDGQKINERRGQIAYMPQHASLLPWRTVKQNIWLSQELTSQKIDQNRVEQLLQRANLTEVRDAYPYQLSGGMQQRIAFLRTLVSQKSLLCLDEPFAALDALTREEMQQWLRSILEIEKRTVLFITHSIEEALILSDRIYVLSHKPMKILHEVQVPISHKERFAKRYHPAMLGMHEEIRGFLQEGMR